MLKYLVKSSEKAYSVCFVSFICPLVWRKVETRFHCAFERYHQIRSGILFFISLLKITLWLRTILASSLCVLFSFFLFFHVKFIDIRCWCCGCCLVRCFCFCHRHRYCRCRLIFVFGVFFLSLFFHSGLAVSVFSWLFECGSGSSNKWIAIYVLMPDHRS